MNELKNFTVCPGSSRDTVTVGTKDPEQLPQLLGLYFNGVVNKVEKDDDMWYVEIPLVSIVRLTSEEIIFV